MISKTLASGRAAAQQIACANWGTRDREPVSYSHVSQSGDNPNGPPCCTCRSVFSKHAGDLGLLQAPHQA